MDAETRVVRFGVGWVEFMYSVVGLRMSHRRSETSRGSGEGELQAER